MIDDATKGVARMRIIAYLEDLLTDLVLKTYSFSLDLRALVLDINGRACHDV